MTFFLSYFFELPDCHLVIAAGVLSLSDLDALHADEAVPTGLHPNACSIPSYERQAGTLPFDQSPVPVRWLSDRRH